MNIDLVVHKQLNAREILVVGDKWKELYDFFQNSIRKYGIYFYTYKDISMPFYVGKCTAKSFNILGRVWDELDDLDRGSSWLGKDINLLQEFEPFNEADPNSNSFNPIKKLTGKNLKNRIKRFVDNIYVTFAYLNINEDARVVDKILTDIETILQERLIERKLLIESWIDTSDIKNEDLAREYRFNVRYKMDKDYVKIDDSIFM